MPIVARCLASFTVIASFAATAGAPQTNVALATTFCEIVDQSERWTGKRVQFWASVISDGIDHTALADPNCNAQIIPQISDEAGRRADVKQFRNSIFVETPRGTAFKRVSATFVGTFLWDRRVRTLQLERVEDLRVQSLGTGKSIAAGPPRVRNCDFAQYHPLRMSSDWLWHGGIAKRVEPEYPPEAKRKRLEGRISVRVLIDGDGNVELACGDGPPALRDAAERAALQWIFRPPKLNGERIRYIQETLQFNFVLDGSSEVSGHR